MDPYSSPEIEADESIMQSLNQINSEYPTVQSPARPDAPVFDATPVGVDASRVVHGRPSVGPMFDSTPLPGTSNEPRNVTNPEPSDPAMSPAPECTPVWEDTPSQSVDGPDVVTQPQDAQEQLDKYNAARAAREAKYQKELKAYERKKALRPKGSEPSPPVGPDAPLKDVPVSPPPPTRPRRAVAKRKVARSPCGTARLGRNTIATSSSDEEVVFSRRSRGKCMRIDDKTFSRDEHTEDDASHAEDVKEEVIRKKRKLFFDNPSVSKLKYSKKMLKRPQGRKKKDEEGEGAKKRFQQTVRCSIGTVRDAAALLKDAHRLKVRAGGFGCVFYWVLEGNISSVLMCYLILSIDTSNMTINSGGGRTLIVNREAVHQIFGFPIGGIAAPRPSDTGHRDALDRLKREFGIVGQITIKKLLSLLAVVVNDDDKVDLAVKIFYAILYNQLICLGSAPRISREAVMLIDMDDEVMAQSDYCQLVVDEVKRSAIKYQNLTIPQVGPEGCGLVPTVMYLDSCKWDGLSVFHIKTPRANFLREGPLLEIYYRDMLKNGGSVLADYKFGRLGWKGDDETVYNYCLPSSKRKQSQRRWQPATPSKTMEAKLAEELAAQNRDGHEEEENDEEEEYEEEEYEEEVDVQKRTSSPASTSGFFSEEDYGDSGHSGDDGSHIHGSPKFDDSVRHERGDSAAASKVLTPSAAESGEKEQPKGSPARDKASAGSPVVQSKMDEVVVDPIGTEESTDIATDQFVVYVHNTAQASGAVAGIADMSGSAHQPPRDPAVDHASEGVHESPGATDADADIDAPQNASAAAQTAPLDDDVHESVTRPGPEAYVAVDTEAAQTSPADRAEHESVSRHDTPAASEHSPVEEHLVEKENTENIGLFATFDPPESLGGVGHFCLVVLNIKERRFELLDSLRGRNDPDAIRVMHVMSRNIKKLWREADDKRGRSVNPYSIDDWQPQYINSSQHDCGFFMLQNMNSYDSTGLVIFNQEDILNIRMTMLYNWLVNSDFRIDIQSIFGVNPGPPLGLEEDDFSLFETQCSTPVVHDIAAEPLVKAKTKAQRILGRLQTSPPRKKTKNDGPVAVDDDDDDFVSNAIWKRKGRTDPKYVQACGASSSGDFVTQKPKAPQQAKDVAPRKKATAEKQKEVQQGKAAAATKKSTRVAKIKVPKLVPYKFPLVSEAKQIKDLILSKEYIREHGSDTLVQFLNPYGDTYDIDAKAMYKLFGRCEMMESETMDYIISYWKDAPDMKYMFESGDRVILSPNVIPYLLAFAPFPSRDSKNNPMPRPGYDVEAGANIFKDYVREDEDLLKSNLIIFPHFMNEHHTVYVINKYSGNLKYLIPGSTLRKAAQPRHVQHADRVEIISRFVQVMKRVYGADVYNKYFVHDWEAAAEDCVYMTTPEQGANECGFYAMKIMCLFDGLKLVQNKKTKILVLRTERLNTCTSCCSITTTSLTR